MHPFEISETPSTRCWARTGVFCVLCIRHDDLGWYRNRLRCVMVGRRTRAPRDGQKRDEELVVFAHCPGPRHSPM